MDLSVDTRSKNELMGREDVSFTVKFESAIPSRKMVREALATAIGVNSANVVLVRLRGGFGVRTAKGMAHAYFSEQMLKKNEKKHLLIRDGLAKKEEKKPKAKAAPAKK